MRPMKHSANVVQRYSNTRSSTLCHLGAESDEQRLDVLPGDVGSLRFLEYGLESVSMFRLHES